MASKKSELFMGTTEISAERSAGEITGLLVKCGAKQIATDYQNGKIAGLRFILAANGRDWMFSLPARTEPVFQLLVKRKPWSVSRTRLSKPNYEDRLRADAERIGWRQLFRWVQAQTALMDLGMVSASEVFFPYLNFDASGQTLFQKFEGEGLKLLTAGAQ